MDLTIFNKVRQMTFTSSLYSESVFHCFQHCNAAVPNFLEMSYLQVMQYHNRNRSASSPAWWFPEGYQRDYECLRCEGANWQL